MSPSDSRIPVVFATLADAVTDDALLLAPSVIAPAGIATGRVGGGVLGHPSACTCCASRSGAAQVMAALYLARARGDVAFFSRLVVALDAAGAAAVHAALVEDRFVAARYRAISRTSPDTAAAAANSAPTKG
jgi:hypothetical protein